MVHWLSGSYFLPWTAGRVQAHSRHVTRKPQSSFCWQSLNYTRTHGLDKFQPIKSNCVQCFSTRHKLQPTTFESPPLCFSTSSVNLSRSSLLQITIISVKSKSNGQTTTNPIRPILWMWESNGPHLSNRGCKRKAFAFK